MSQASGLLSERAGDHLLDMGIALERRDVRGGSAVGGSARRDDEPMARDGAGRRNCLVGPGNVYGWPKNVLHWEGIDNSIVELAATIPVHYVIADGIVAMEGNGPLHGPSRHLGCLLFADDPIAADATCCRLMGIEPLRINHLQMTAPIGNSTFDRITHVGEPIASLRQTFVLMPEFRHISAQ